MRLPAAKIREALVHPEKLVRQEALDYFSNCTSRDAEVMPLVIQAIQTYGRSHAFVHLNQVADLKQTEATVAWAIEELHREEDRDEDFDSFFPALSQLLCSADPPLITPHADQILQATGFSKELAPELEERLRLATWDAEQCWKELERISAEGVGKEYSSDVDTGRASQVVKALARQGDPYVDRILDLLGQKVVDFETDPMTWLEIFLVELAGEMRLERAIPLVVQKLHQCGEVLSEECVEALGKIGTDAAAEAVAEDWLESEWEYRIYATSALEKIHSDTTVRKCLELLLQDQDLDIRTNLADALLSQFDDAGIEPVRQMVQQGAYDWMISDLMRKLVAVSTTLGVTFPEFPIWKREAEARLAEEEQSIKEMARFFQARTKPALPLVPAPVWQEYPERKPAPFLRTEKQVGRNDPCPCGSGKKFKKCCMSRGK